MKLTNKEASEWLMAIKKYYIHGGDEDYDERRKIALDMAIKALEQEPTEPLYRLVTDNDNLMLLEDYKTGTRTVIEKRIEPCENCVSRKAEQKGGDLLAIEELESLKAEINEQIDFNKSCCERTDLHEAIGIINRHIAELKGEQK